MCHQLLSLHARWSAGLCIVSSIFESEFKIVCGFKRLSNPQILQDAGMWSPLLFDLLTVPDVLPLSADVSGQSLGHYVDFRPY